MSCRSSLQTAVYKNLRLQLTNPVKALFSGTLQTPKYTHIPTTTSSWCENLQSLINQFDHHYNINFKYYIAKVINWRNTNFGITTQLSPTISHVPRPSLMTSSPTSHLESSTFQGVCWFRVENGAEYWQLLYIFEQSGRTLSWMILRERYFLVNSWIEWDQF